MTCIDCGQPANGRRCTHCRRARERDGDERWDDDETRAERRCQVDLGDGGDDDE